MIRFRFFYFFINIYTLIQNYYLLFVFLKNKKIILYMYKKTRIWSKEKVKRKRKKNKYIYKWKDLLSFINDWNKRAYQYI